MPWAVAATVVVGAYSAGQQKKAANKGANAAAAGSAADIAERQRQYDLTRADQKPWLESGTRAIGQMEALNAGDYSSFTKSPDYAFNVQQQMQGLDRNAAANGRLYSGGTDVDRMTMMSGLAANQYGNYYSRLQAMAGQGQVTGQNLGVFGANMANGNALSRQGATNARMSSYASAADANSQFAAGVGNAFTNYMGRRNGWAGY